jgi:hypothetical protein
MVQAALNSYCAWINHSFKLNGKGLGKIPGPFFSMKKRSGIHLIMFLASALGLCGCSPGTGREKPADFRSFLVDSFSLPVPFSGYDPNYTSICVNTPGVIYMLDKDCMALHKFDAIRKKFSGNTRLPFPASRHITYSVLGKDFTCVIEEYRTIVMLNDSGRKVKEWTITDSIPTFGTEYRLWGASGFPLLADKDNFYVLYAPKIKLNTEDGRKKLFSSAVLLAISKQNGKISDQLLQFPKTYLENFFEVLCPSYTLNDDGKLVAAFGTEDSIQVCDPHSGELKTKEMKSAFFKPRSPFSWDGKEEYFAYKQRYAVENAEYYTIHYDPYRKKYYRVCLHKDKYLNPDGTTNERLEPAWSLVIADSAFHIQREIVFPRSAYDYRDIQVTRGGVLISRNNPFNPGYKKNQLHYAIFRF